MSGWRCMVFSGLVIGAWCVSQAQETLPVDAAKLVAEYERDETVLRLKIDLELRARKQTLIKRLQEVRDALVKQGLFDEALDVHQKIKSLRDDAWEVEWGGTWWPAEILQLGDGKTLIHYTGWDDAWDEWVTPERIRTRPKPPVR